MGLNVPKFLGVSNEKVQKLFDKNGVLIEEEVQKLAQEIHKEMQCASYAVRSSGLMEDADGSAYAGQFHTELGHNAESLQRGISLVLNQAYKFLDGRIEEFSLLVQEYVEADYAGVIFSRNPIGGREMVLEYYQGIGAQVVGGEVRPEKLSFYWNYQPKGFEELVEAAKKIEEEFAFAQDIEWCKKGEQFYLLQARPITTLTKNQYESYLYLDELLPKDRDFLFEETEVSEIAPQPANLTLDILREVYKKDGPADLVYRKFGVDYLADDFLFMISNELYIDREKEIKTLLPSYSYLGRHFQLHFASLKGFWRTMKNIWHLNKLSLLDYQDLRRRLVEALSFTLDKNADFKARLEHFLKDYQLIFEINLLAAKALRGLDQALLKEDVANALVINATFDDDYEGIINFDSEGLRGNSLDIADESEFFFSLDTPEMDIEVKRWYQGLSNFKRRLYLPICIRAQRYNKLREYGRWLTVKNISYLREALPEKENIYFASLKEILQGKIDEKKCEERAKQHKDFDRLDFPPRITSYPIKSRSKLLGVSGGKASGRVVTKKNLKKGDILYVKMLTPDLTKYFDRVAGIISEKGGMLSHLAIMARENKIPVVVGFDIEKSTVEMGDVVKIDGGEGTVKEI